MLSVLCMDVWPSTRSWSSRLPPKKSDSPPWQIKQLSVSTHIGEPLVWSGQRAASLLSLGRKLGSFYLLLRSVKSLRDELVFRSFKQGYHKKSCTPAQEVSLMSLFSGSNKYLRESGGLGYLIRRKSAKGIW